MTCDDDTFTKQQPAIARQQVGNLAETPPDSYWNGLEAAWPGTQTQGSIARSPFRDPLTMFCLGMAVAGIVLVLSELAIWYWLGNSL